MNVRPNRRRVTIVAPVKRHAASVPSAAAVLLLAGLVAPAAAATPAGLLDHAAEPVTLAAVYETYPWMRSLADYPRGASPYGHTSSTVGYSGIENLADYPRGAAPRP
jgi:hypothetical protein